ncbi:helix-turn-helix transcriptional regulator [Collinsella tanakaei]|nr:helix-turn-helix transcriptional regulator [Collinsella tanakaei]
MNVQIAQRLAELRRAKGYSQEALANELGLSRQAVSKWERAESSPDTENLIALARLYGVSLDDLLNVDKDVEDDVAFENAERAEKTARVQAEREEALREQRAHQEAMAQATAAATQASEAAARAAQAAAAASEQAASARTSAAAAAGSPAGPASDTPRRRGPWRSFPYSVVATILFFVFCFGFHAWTTAWLVFLTIPIYHWIANIMDDSLGRGDDGTAPAAPQGVRSDEEGRR